MAEKKIEHCHRVPGMKNHRYNIGLDGIYCIECRDKIKFSEPRAVVATFVEMQRRIWEQEKTITSLDEKLSALERKVDIHKQQTTGAIYGY